MLDTKERKENKANGRIPRQQCAFGLKDNFGLDGQEGEQLVLIHF